MNQRPRADNADQISGAVGGSGARRRLGRGDRHFVALSGDIPSMIVTILDTGSLDG